MDLKKNFSEEFSGFDSLGETLLLIYLAIFLIYTVQGSYIIEQAGDEWSVSGYTSSEPVEDWYNDEPFPEEDEFVLSMHQYEDRGEQSLVFFSGADDSAATIALSDIPGDSRVRVSEDTGDLSLSQTPEGDWEWSSGNVGGALELLGVWESLEIEPDTEPSLIYSGEDGIVGLEDDEPITVRWEGVHPPHEPDPEDGEIVQSEETEISAVYDHAEGDTGSITLYNESDDSIIEECQDLNPGERCSTDWNLDLDENYWYGIADDEDDSRISPTWELIYNNEPEVYGPQSPGEGERIYGDSVELEVDVEDEDGDDLDVQFYKNDSQTEDTQTVTGGEGTASIETDVDRGEYYEWYANVSNEYSTVQSETWSFDVNPLPSITSPEPSDGGLVTDDEVDISVVADSDEYDQLDVYFENQTDILGKETIEAGERAEQEWRGLDVGESYEWQVNVSDGFENQTSDLFEFTRLTSESYRVDKDLEYEYTTLILTEGERVDFLFTVENRIDSSQTLETFLEGPNPEFIDTGESSVEYSLDSYESREFHIELEAEGPGVEELEMITQDQRTGINTTETVPVHVREHPPVHQVREVPGIGTIQIMLIALLATCLYFVRL